MSERLCGHCQGILSSSKPLGIRKGDKISQRWDVFLLSISLSALDPGRQNGRLSPAHHQSPPLHLLGLIPTLLGPAPPQHTCLPPPSVTVEDSVS